VQLGELVLVPDLGEAERLAARTASLLRMVVFCLTAALGLTLAFVVRRTIILPIAALSHRLHLLAPETGALLTGIRSHERDELGQLVRDVNALLERLMEALRQERLQGEQRALEHMKTQSLIQNAGTGMFLVNAEATLEAWTPAFLRMLEREQPLPVRGAELLPLFGDSGALVRDCLARCRFGARQVVEVFRVGNAGAEGHRWLQLCLDPMEKGWIQGLLEDVTALRGPTETAGARQLAVRDPLTGLLNRLGAEQAMADLFFRNRGGLALVMVDLDQFQAVNDSFGHEAGDAVLRQVAARLQASLRHTDLVARLGGDEFIAVLDNMTNESLLQDLARKLIAAINLPIALPGGGEVQVGCSLGLVLQEPGSVLSRTVLLKRADTAMYLAKQAGRNCARLFGAD